MLFGGMLRFSFYPLTSGRLGVALFHAAMQHDTRHRERQGAIMSAAQRIHRSPAAPAEPEKIEFAEYMTNLATSGAGRIAEVQKKALDVAVQQHTELVDLWMKIVKKLPGAPGLFLFELENSGFERFAETQKAVIDLMVEQNRAIAALLENRTTETADTVVKFAQEGVERAVATQKKVLDHAAAQSKEVFDTSREKFAANGGPAEAVADSIQRGVNAIVDAQKELLAMVVH
jgi:hypothetical protein